MKPFAKCPKLSRLPLTDRLTGLLGLPVCIVTRPKRLVEQIPVIVLIPGVGTHAVTVRSEEAQEE